MSDIKIFRASAGSGKTYKITEEYLKIVLKYPEAYKNILAVTFTNKATDEMKLRVLQELHILASNKKSEQLSALTAYFKLSEVEIRKKAKLVLTNILHDYSRFSFKTIEGFFQSLLQAFTREIGLNEAVKIELNTDIILNEAIKKLFENIKYHKQLQKWLIEFTQEKISNNKHWNISRDIENLGKVIFKEVFLNLDKELINIFEDKTAIETYLAEVRNINKKFVGSLTAIGTEAIKIITDEGYTVNDFKYKETGVAGYLFKLSSGKVHEPKKRVQDCYQSTENWLIKSHQSYNHLQNIVESKLQKLLIQAVDFYNENVLNSNTASTVSKNIRTLAILGDISKMSREYSIENSLFLLSDGSKLLNEIIGDNDTPFIYEKVGQWYKHLMIDEFQDTSDMQWKNFLPLFINSLSEGGTNLIVGDIKQSIYRWRNSNWQLFLDTIYRDLSNFKPDDSLNLDTNWRSFANVVHFNNNFFSNAPKLLDLLIKKNINNEKVLNELGINNKISIAYNGVNQKVSSKKSKTKGFVKFTFSESKKIDDFQSFSLKELSSQIDSLIKAGYNFSDLVILVRKKKEAKLIVDFFLEKFNKYPIASDEALLINASFVVRFIVLCLRYVVFPGDAINTTNIIFDYQLYISPDTLNKQNDIIADASKLSRKLEEFFIKAKNLNKLSLYEFVQYIILYFDLKGFKGQNNYLEAFQDVILEFGNQTHSNKLMFLEWWDERGKGKALKLQQNLNAIRVMTIHKAKGLEFNVVLLPFCNWKIDHESKPSPIIWCGTKQEPFNKVPLIPVNYSSSLSKTYFKNDYYKEMLLAYVDNLNLLYVAFTRAKEALIVNAPKQKSDDLKTVSDLIANIIQEDPLFIKKQYPSTDESPEHTVYEYGLIERQQTNVKEEQSIEWVISDTTTKFQNNFQIRRRTGSLENDFVETISPVNYGKLMHFIFENIDYENDIESAVNKAVVQGLISEQEKSDYINSIKKYLNNKQAKEWFTANWKIKTEASILLPGGEIYRPDRIIYRNSEAVVIDYKFSSEKHQSHENQLRNYKIVMQKMNFKVVNAYLWYVLKNEVIPV